MHYNEFIMNTKITHLVVSKLQNMFDRELLDNHSS